MKARKIAFTDAPPLHSNLILGSLHLCFWLILHPSAWRNYLIRLDPALRPDFALAELTADQWRNPALRRLVGQGHLILPCLAALPTAFVLWRQGASLENIIIGACYVLAINLTLGLMFGAVLSSGAGLIGGMVVGLGVGTVGSLTGGGLESIAVPTAISLAIGGVAGLTVRLKDQPAASTSSKVWPTMQIRLGGIVVGVLAGVVAASLIRLGLTTLADLTAGLPESTTYYPARSIVVGTSFGVALSWRRRSFLAGLVGTGLCSLAYLLAVRGGFSDWGPAPVGLSAGLLFGLSFGVTVILPYLLAEQIAGSWAGSWAGALGSWGRHILRNQAPLWPTAPLGLIGIPLGLSWPWWQSIGLYPFTAAWNTILYRLDQQQARQRPTLLRWHSAFWDEFQRLPLGGLDEYLLLIVERNPDEGKAALDYLKTSGRQRWAVQAVQIELEAQRLQRCSDLRAIGQVHYRLGIGGIAGAANTFLRTFSYLSQDIEAALNQSTPYHQRLALSAIDDRLNGLVRELTLSDAPYTKRFYPVTLAWQQVIVNHLQDLAEAVEHSQELDNPYIVAVPLTWQQEVFVGRTDIVARIEQLLLDRRHPPLLLYGQRRMGKTSLLRNLGRLLPRTIVPLFADCQRVSLASNYPDFLYNLASEMRRSAEQQRDLALPPLSQETLAASPFTAFNEWLDAIEKTLETEGYHIALLTLDEFEALDSVLDKGRFDETDVLSMIRHIIQHRPQFKVLLATSHPLEEFQRWAGYLINVQIVKVGYLKEDEARTLIEQPVKNFALRYEPEAARRVLDVTRGHPALIQLLCYELVTLKNEQNTTTRRLASREDVAEALNRALESGNFFFADIAHNQVDVTGLVVLEFIARQGENVPVSRTMLADQIDAPSLLDQALHHLEQRDLIENIDDRYQFQVELIRRWFA